MVMDINKVMDELIDIVRKHPELTYQDYKGNWLYCSCNFRIINKMNNYKDKILKLIAKEKSS